MTFNDTLDISALKNAYIAYGKMIERARLTELKEKELLEFYEFEGVQAGLIQHFEFSYELSWKFMERFFVREGLPSGFTRKGLFREAIRVGLIEDFHGWVKYNEARNKTSHTYDEVTAEEVYEAAKVFFLEFERFIAALESKL